MKITPRFPDPDRSDIVNLQFTNPKLLFFQQEQTNWCWAACAQMVINYIVPSALANSRQCDFANWIGSINKRIDLLVKNNEFLRPYFKNIFWSWLFSSSSKTYNSSTQINCCTSPMRCNFPCEPEDISMVYRQWQIHSRCRNSKVTIREIQKELRNHHPVEVAYAWNNGEGHIYLIFAWGKDIYENVFFTLYDPQDGNSTIHRRYDQLFEFNRGNWVYTWTHLRRRGD